MGWKYHKARFSHRNVILLLPGSAGKRWRHVQEQKKKGKAYDNQAFFFFFNVEKNVTSNQKVVTVCIYLHAMPQSFFPKRWGTALERQLTCWDAFL